MDLMKYKGIHPGAVISRLLDKRKISHRSFALSLPEHPQTFHAILKGKRSLNTSLALKIEDKLELEEGVLMMLQVYYEIGALKKLQRLKHHPDFNVIKKSLFWDTDFSSIDWEKNHHSVIKRVFERGDESQRREISRFYGWRRIKNILQQYPFSNGQIPLMAKRKLV